MFLRETLTYIPSSVCEATSGPVQPSLSGTSFYFENYLITYEHAQQLLFNCTYVPIYVGVREVEWNSGTEILLKIWHQIYVLADTVSLTSKDMHQD